MDYRDTLLSLFARTAPMTCVEWEGRFQINEIVGKVGCYL